MERQGRAFERVVQALERCWSPEVAVIRSPDYLRDRITGENREVDVSVRYRVGTIPILVIIECRDRGDVQDVTWIEQLARKRDDVNAARAVAVSSSGFTKPAVQKAKHDGIELRTVEQLTLANISHWCPVASITTVQPHAEILDVQLFLGNGATPSDRDIFDTFRTSDGELALDRPIFTASNGTTVALSHIWKYAVTTAQTFSNVPAAGPRLTRTLRCNLDDPNDRFSVAIGSQILEVLAITFIAELWHESLVSPPGKVYSYTDPSGVGIEAIDHHIVVAGRHVIVSTQRDTTSEEVRILLRKEPGT